MPLLSAAIIARDEQLMLPDCLASLQGIADEVVVLDTGSVDLTREIAEAAGAIVDTLAWTGNFATARNAAIDRCSGEWILYIDCDERIRPGTAGNLRASLCHAGAIGYQVRFHVRPALTPYWELRLFRNDPALRFEGVIHENIWPALLRLVETQVFDVPRLPLTIDHIGYEANQERKNARNLPLLQQAVQSDPDHVYCWAELGRIHYERGDLRGLGTRFGRVRTWSDPRPLSSGRTACRSPGSPESAWKPVIPRLLRSSRKPRRCFQNILSSSGCKGNWRYGANPSMRPRRASKRWRRLTPMPSSTRQWPTTIDCSARGRSAGLRRATLPPVTMRMRQLCSRTPRGWTLPT